MPRITRTPSVSSNSSSGSSDTADAESATFSDWASSLHGAHRTLSLFDDSLLDSPQDAVAYDARVHGFDLDQVLATLSLKDDYARIRLVNYIRKEVSLRRETSKSFVHLVSELETASGRALQDDSKGPSSLHQGRLPDSGSRE